MRMDQVEEKLTYLWRKALDSKKLSEDDTNRMSIMAFMYSCGRYNKYQVLIRLTHLITTLDLMKVGEIIDLFSKEKKAGE